MLRRRLLAADTPPATLIIAACLPPSFQPLDATELAMLLFFMLISCLLAYAA